MSDGRKRTSWVAVGSVAVIVVGVVAVTQIVPSIRRDSVELCGRRFRRGDAVWEDQKVQSLGVIHQVGSSRVDEGLWTVSSAWPEGRCDGLTPTVLLSRDGDEWRTWTLVGGP
jgi:hypothetical protein